MTDKITAVPEFCFLWIPHWSTCMTKAEWASWGQVAVGLVAIYAASRAVRAAHSLAMGAKANEEFNATLRLIDKELNYFGRISRELCGLAKSIEKGRDVDLEKVSALMNLCMRLHNENYSSFDVVELTPKLITARDMAIRALDALGRIQEGHRRASRSEFLSEKQAVIEAAKGLDGLLETMNQWRIIFLKGHYP